MNHAIDIISIAKEKTKGSTGENRLQILLFSATFTFLENDVVSKLIDDGEIPAMEICP